MKIIQIMSLIMLCSCAELPLILQTVEIVAEDTEIMLKEQEIKNQKP